MVFTDLTIHELKKIHGIKLNAWYQTCLMRTKTALSLDVKHRSIDQSSKLSYDIFLIEEAIKTKEIR